MHRLEWGTDLIIQPKPPWTMVKATIAAATSTSIFTAVMLSTAI